MTRGKIFFIHGDLQVYATCEFNGDMHPGRYGGEVLEYFRNGFFQNYRNCESFVENFNRKHFGYDAGLITKVFGYGKQEKNLKATGILTKQEFVDIMNRLQEASDLQSQVDALFRSSRENIENDFYGRKYEAGMITNANGRDVDLHTPELLYDFISNNGVTCQKGV